MQLDFFPSRTLTLYLAKTFVLRILAVLVMLVVVLLALDLLGNTGKILEPEGNGQAEILKYASLRIPQLITQFVPYSVLLATLITLVTLNQNSEVVAMKAAGLSAHQVLSPLLLTAGVLALCMFVFNERVTTRANSTLKAWDAAEYGAIPEETGMRANVILSDGQSILSAAKLSGNSEGIELEDVTWDVRGPGFIVTEQIKASRAVYAGPGWRLENAERFSVGAAEIETLDTVVVGENLTPTQIDLQSIDVDGQSFWELAGTISALEAVGRRTTEMRAKWWHRISGPLSAFLMPLLGSIAAFGLARSGQLFVRAVIGMALGFAYFVIDNAALAMGSLGGYPPFLAAWAPFLLFFLVGETVLIRTEE